VHALDAEYDTSRQLPGGNVAAYFERFATASAEARTRVLGYLGRRYGPHERETIDFFPATKAGAPLFVFIHGGYWRRMSKDFFSFVAPPLVDAGAAVAVVNYPLAPGPSLDEIVASVRRGYAYALAHADDLRANRREAYLGGHSVGAQLAAMVAANSEVRGLFGLCGIYDLAPLRSTMINEWIAMDADAAVRNGPIHNPPLGNPSLVVAAGGKEQAAFQEQQDAYVAAWRGWHHGARELDAAELNHFSIVLELADPASPIARALRELIGL
jgi:arylformamidase